MFFNFCKSCPPCLRELLSFPSPYGDFVFQRERRKSVPCMMLFVSVPLRGFCFSTTRKKSTKEDAKEFPSPYGDFVFQPSSSSSSSSLASSCFRPLTGILFFNRPKVRRAYPSGRREFPSPYGDFVFQLAEYLGVSVEDLRDVSVPLRGFCFSTLGDSH